MGILIAFYSAGSHTRTVAELVQKRFICQNHEVLVRNALTSTAEQLKTADLILIGTPVHGYILFGQKPSQGVRNFLNERLPKNLDETLVIGYVNYLFFPRKALSSIKRTSESRNGKIFALLAQQRAKKRVISGSDNENN